jgi:hypothetical protein
MESNEIHQDLFRLALTENTRKFNLTQNKGDSTLPFRALSKRKKSNSILGNLLKIAKNSMIVNNLKKIPWNKTILSKNF